MWCGLARIGCEPIVGAVSVTVHVASYNVLERHLQNGAGLMAGNPPGEK